MQTRLPEEPPNGFRFDFISSGDVLLHVLHNGHAFEGAPLADKRKPLLLLHGFPEYWIAWEEVIKELGQSHLIIVPDQRGYNLSDAPAGVEHYKTKLLISDMMDLTQAMLGERKFTIGGHDWGASIAYALAIRFPEKINGLFIANGVHPACFQQALIDSPAQAKASAYFHILRSEQAPQLMSEDDFRRTFSMFEKFSHTPWLTTDMKARYRQAWSDEARLGAMLNWYNSSPIFVPSDGEPVPKAPLYNADRDAFRITMPHRVVWGMGDQALLAECRERLPEFCNDLTVHEITDADHWILHTHAPEIANQINALLDEV